MDTIFKRGASVTPSDTANIPNISQQDGLGNRGCFLYIGVAITTLKVRTSAGDDITIKAPAIGKVLPIEVVRVFVTGTAPALAANDVVALWRI
jgi:hypothetical protein